MLPLPPADLSDLDLPLQVVPVGTTLHRIHPPEFGPIFFGPGAGRPPAYRFDDPRGEYGVCYLGCSRLAAFVETHLRDLSTLVVSETNLAHRDISGIEVRRDLRVVQAHSEGLFRLGTTAALGAAKLAFPGASPDQAYAHAMAWSRALHDHDDAPDGVAYHSSHDDSLACLALFGDRAGDAIRPAGPPARLSGEQALVAEAVARYNLVLLPALPVGRRGADR